MGKQYVDREAVKKVISCGNLPRWMVDAFQNLIDDIPAEDVEKVRHGHWSMTEDGAAYCSACKRKMNAYMYGYARCAICGAKMDGLVEER